MVSCRNDATGAEGTMSERERVASYLAERAEWARTHGDDEQAHHADRLGECVEGMSDAEYHQVKECQRAA